MTRRLFDVQGGPGRWVAGDQVLETAPGIFSEIPQPLIVVGEFFLREKVRSRLQQPLLAAGYELQEVNFPALGQCSEAQISALSAQIPQNGTLLGLGGGKCLDAVKLLAHRQKRSVITIPTSAATCACASNVAVVYNERGVYQDTLEIQHAPLMVLLDSALLSGQPRFVAAGLVDAAAKWLEWQALPPAARNEFASEAGLAMAKLCWEHARDSSADCDCRYGLEEAVETSIYFSAQASCLGNAPAAAAHSICNALSLFEECQTLLHGELVGLGLLVQDALLKARGLDLEGMAQRRDWLLRLGMPVKLSKRLSPEQIDQAVKKAMNQGESLMDMQPPVQIQELIQALECIQP